MMAEKGLASAFIACSFYLFGAFDLALQALVLFMAFDYITGIVKAIKKKEFSYSTGCWGITKKVCLLMLVAMAYRIDLITGMHGNISGKLIVIFALLGNEVISILQNMSSIEAGVPKKVIDYFKAYAEKVGR